MEWLGGGELGRYDGPVGSGGLGISHRGGAGSGVPGLRAGARSLGRVGHVSGSRYDGPVGSGGLRISHRGGAGNGVPGLRAGARSLGRVGHVSGSRCAGPVR
ncbi:hypothetical protein [Streptomyces sp. NPDC057794]|uniref:hypothetical protein n=1 Tax=Streptomyces sp. NPDC057794 TaxID=3346251 RepID=UPI0036C3664B